MGVIYAMAISGTNFKRNTLNNSIGNEPKVDQAIVDTLFEYTRIVSKPYSSQTDRYYKYEQAKDLMLMAIVPYITPKVYKEDWARRFFKLTRSLKDSQKLSANLDYYQFLLSEAMMFVTIVLYSNNYYMLEDLSDKEYQEMIARGGEIEVIA